MSINFGATVKGCITASLCIALSACGISAETQAKIVEYDNTIPSCSSDLICTAKWAAARAWVLENASFGIRSEDESHIATFTAVNTRSGTSVRVDKVAASGDDYQIIVDVECFAAYGCPNLWDTMLDFNRVVGAASP